MINLSEVKILWPAGVSGTYRGGYGRDDYREGFLALELNLKVRKSFQKVPAELFRGKHTYSRVRKHHGKRHGLAECVWKSARVAVP